MGMQANDIERLVSEAIPDARITLRDLAGDNDHYEIEVVSEAFRGKSRIEQHRMVMDALKGGMGTALHALSIATRVP